MPSTDGPPRYQQRLWSDGPSGRHLRSLAEAPYRIVKASNDGPNQINLLVFGIYGSEQVVRSLRQLLRIEANRDARHPTFRSEAIGLKGLGSRRKKRHEERVTRPPKLDLRRRGSVNRHGRCAASRSVVGSGRTVLADCATTATGWAAASLRSRVSHRHYLRSSKRYSLANAPAGTRVRGGDDVLASLA